MPVINRDLVEQLESSLAFLSWRFKLYGGWHVKREMNQCITNLKRARLGKLLIDYEEKDSHHATTTS